MQGRVPSGDPRLAPVGYGVLFFRLALEFFLLARAFSTGVQDFICPAGRFRVHPFEGDVFFVRRQANFYSAS